jgi:hypothetical protein
VSNPNQQDDDGDGIGNACDLCPATIAAAPVDAHGCPPPIIADFDRDGDVDLTDFGLLQLCFSGSGVPCNPSCAVTDVNSDGAVDQFDFNSFNNCLTGTNIFAAACAQ